MKQVRIALVGLGNVGKAFLQLMVEKEAPLRTRMILALVPTAAADSSGALSTPRASTPPLLAAKLDAAARAFRGRRGRTVCGRCGRAADADLLLELAGQSAHGPARAGLRPDSHRPGHVVRAGQQGAVVRAFAELTGAARMLAWAGLQRHGVRRCRWSTSASATAGCEIRGVRGIFNSTSNSIFEAMGLGGSHAQALKQAQVDGIAEADPSPTWKGGHGEQACHHREQHPRRPCDPGGRAACHRHHWHHARADRAGRGRGQGGEARCDGGKGRRWVPLLRPARVAAEGQFSGHRVGVGDGDHLRHRHHGPSSIQGR